MVGRMRWLLTILLCCPIAALAQEPPRCTGEMVGTVACIAGKLCACRVDPGGPGLKPGTRWDCGVLRPACGPARPITIDPWLQGLPPGLSLEVPDTIVKRPRRWPRPE